MVNLLTVKATKISMTCALTQLGSWDMNMEAECANQIHISQAEWKGL